MDLSKDQIEELFDFTRKKYVHFYDLQVEIVDHLAAAIEDKMAINRKLTFEQALAEVYQGFGIFGFAHVVREKEKQIDKQSFYMYWNEVRKLFTWPHLLLSGLIFISIFTLTNYIPLLYLTLFFIIGVTTYTIHSIKKLKVVNSQKKLRMMVYFQPGTVFLYVYLQVLAQVNLIDPLFFTLGTSLGVISIIASIRLNEKVKSNAMKLYPEAFVID